MKPRLSFAFLASIVLSALASAVTYNEWLAASFSEEQLNDEALSGTTADPDGDGIKNLVEYAFNGQPLIVDSNLGTMAETIAGHIALTYRERQGMTDVSIRLQGSDNLQNWITYNTVPPADREVFTGYDQVTLLDPVPFSSRRFVRLQIDLLPIYEPRAPEQLALAVVTPTTFSISWTDPNATEAGYALERRLSNLSWERLATVSPDIGDWQHSAANYKTSMTYRAVAIGADGKEAVSAPVTLTDTDGDGIPDGLELKNSYSGVAGTYATDPNQFSSNGSGVSDGWLVENGYDPILPLSLETDADGDGLSDIVEAGRGTNPHATDTDGDGVPDTEDGWPNQRWITAAPLTETAYMIVPLADLGWNSSRSADWISDTLSVVSRDAKLGDSNYYFSPFPEPAFSSPARHLSSNATLLSLMVNNNIDYNVNINPLSVWNFVYRDWHKPLDFEGRFIGGIFTNDSLKAALIDPNGTAQTITFSPPPPQSPTNQSLVFRSNYAHSINKSGDTTTLEAASFREQSPPPGQPIERTNMVAGFLHKSNGEKILLGEWARAGTKRIGPYAIERFSEGEYIIPHRINNESVIAFIKRTTGGQVANFGLWEDGSFINLYESGGRPPIEFLTDKIPGSPTFAGYRDNQFKQKIIYQTGGNGWAQDELYIWDPAKQKKTDFPVSVVNNRLEMVASSGLIRNGLYKASHRLGNSNWSIQNLDDINNHGVILATGTRVRSDQGQTVASSPSEPVLLIPYEVVTRDPGSSEVNGQHTEIVATSSPTPEVEFTVVSATVTPSGSLSVVVSGTVADALSEVLTPSEPRVSQMRFKVDGQVIGQPVSVDYTAVSEPLRRTRSRTSFQQTLVIPNAKPRGYTIVAETDANAAGNIGWDKVAVGVNTELVPYTDEASKLSLVFTQAPTSSTPGVAKVYFGTSTPLGGDGTVTETAAGSRSYTGTLPVGAETAVCNLKLHEGAVLTPGTAERLSATFTYQLPDQSAVRATGIWRETGPATQQFMPDGYSFSGERLVVNHTQDLPGSQPSSFEPLVLRLGAPAAWAQAAGFALTANGQPLTLKEFTYEGRTETYAVANASDTHPRIFAASSQELPASIAVANASNEGDTINWTLSLGGNPVFTIATQVVAGPEPFSSELFAANLESLPRWASTDPGSGVGGSNNASVNGWHAPGDTVTITDLRNAYALLYPDGFSKLLLQVFDQQSGYAIELGDVLGDYDFEYANGNVTIQIEHDDDDINPVVAAQYLWQGLNKAHSRIYAYREEVAITAPTQALLEEAYMTWHANAGKAAAQAGVAVAELYLSGIGIVNEGLDWVLVVNDVTEGHYTSMAALLPFVPRAIVSNGGRYVIRNTSGVVRETISTVSKFDAIPALYRETDLRVMGITMEREQFGLFLRKALSSSGGPIPVPKTHGQLRRAMERAGPIPTLTKVQAHHDFPWTLRKWFAEHGVDVNNPAFGRWVAESDHDLWHKRAMPKFNDFWKNWRSIEDPANPYTIQQILDKLVEARSVYPVLNGN